MYAETDDFPMLKLWVDENLRPALKENDWEGSTGYREAVIERGHPAPNTSTYKGYAFEFNDVKWYESYAEVDAVEKAWEKFRETFDEDNDDTTLASEFARIGEDYGDVEYRSTYYSQDLLNIVRHTDY
jgi:hypothetical protein